MSQRLKCWKCGRTYANILTLMNHLEKHGYFMGKNEKYDPLIHPNSPIQWDRKYI